MFSKSNVYALSLGLIGSVSFGLTGVNAQINVTGGSMTGQAAFFVPNQVTDANGISLYGVSVQRLNLQTTNGNTSQAVFSAINSSFTDNGDGVPGADDTGILQGNLSGVAFFNGSPVGFTNRPTELEYTLNSFDTLLNLPGTLASPENFNSKLFLPDPIQYEGDQGVLQLGNFGANLDGGLIGLPSTYRFSDGTTVSNNNQIQSSALRVKFQFRGTNVTPEEGTQLDPNSPMMAAQTVKVYDVSEGKGQLFAVFENGKFTEFRSGEGYSRIANDDGTFSITDENNNNTVVLANLDETQKLAELNTDYTNGTITQTDLQDRESVGGAGGNGIVFIGQANDKFQVQTVGTQATREVKITTNNTLNATGGAVAIAIGDINEYNSEGEFDLTQPLNYKIEGEALSAFTLLDPSLVVSVGGARRDTKFSFEQTGASLEGRSNGFVAFAGLPGATNFTEGLQSLDAESIISNLNPDNCSVCSLGELDPEFSSLIEEASKKEASGVIINERDRGRGRGRDHDRDEHNSNIEVIGGDNSEVGRTIYLLSLTSVEQPRVVVIVLRGDRYFVAVPGNRGRGHGRGLALGRRDRDRVVVFKQIGPSSRIFPGQASIVEVDLNKLPEGFAQALQEVLQDQGLVANNITINNTTINNEVNIEGDNNEVNIDNNVENTNTTNTTTETSPTETNPNQ